MAGFETVLFDLDGTLLYTLPDIARSLNHALTLHGQPTHSEDEVRRFIGWGVRMLLAQALPGGEESPLYSAIMADYRAYYAQYGCEETTVYPGILPLLDRLRERNITVGVVTNKPHNDAEPMIRRFFGDRLPYTLGKKPEAAAKPAPDSLLAAMAQLQADPTRTLYIGDTEVDFQTAQNAGVPCVLVSWGFRTREQLEALKPFAVIDRPEELLNYLEK